MPEKKLATSRAEDPSPQALPVLVDPEIFRALYNTCKLALTTNAGNRLMRDRINDLALSFRRSALRHHGHESGFEETALAGLMRDTDYGSSDVLKETPVERLYRLDYLGNPERNAASLIEQVWDSFDRFLGSRTTRYDQGGGGGGYQGVIPMGANLSRSYLRYYSPWYFACRNRPAKIVGTRKLRPVDIVFQIVVQRVTLTRLASAYDVVQQDIIEIVRGELLSLASRMDAADQSTGGNNAASEDRTEPDTPPSGQRS